MKFIKNISSWKIGKLIFFNLFIIVFLFVVAEGIANTIFYINSAIKVFTPKINEQKYVQYDELLGWINKPNVYINDLWGTGRYHKTNSQSCRNDKDFTVKVPQGKIRIICTGDSFTEGVGVSNDKTWCNLLSSIDNRLETVNMGQAGYGIDQAYLRYMRDGRKLEHDIHIFAFINDNFRRATKNISNSFYPKPVFNLQHDKLVLDNVPVPQYNPYTAKLKTITTAIRDGSKIFDLLGKIKGINAIVNSEIDNDKVNKIALKIFESLHQVNKESGSVLVVLYLGISDDYFKELPRRKFLSDELSKRGIIFIDLTDGIIQQPFYRMFDNHYSEYGNKFVADILYEKLLSIKEIKDKIEH